MLVISNHVRTLGMEWPEGALIRINLAWIQGGIEEARKIIQEIEASGHMSFLDMPTGRRKYPRPSMTLKQAIQICKENIKSVKLFAFSNAEDVNIIEVIRDAVPSEIGLCPKIETPTGVTNLKDIVRAAKAKVIMLDAEDLAMSVDGDNEKVANLKESVRSTCKEIGVTCLELRGVIFA